MKDQLKAVLAKHAYINNWVYSISDRKREAKVSQLVESVKENDYFDDISSLKVFRSEIEKGLTPFFTTNANWSNSHIYGIWQSVFGQYTQNVIGTPSVEHGLIFQNDVFTDIKFTGRASCATLSTFRKEIIQNKLNKPVFCIGPYIHYASSFYSTEKLFELKKKMGRVLLVFPMHSTNNSEISVDEEKFIDSINEIAQNYDTVLVNVYWWNINDNLTKRFESEGYKVVSCGIRDDTSFLSRLKSYILLSDLAISDGIGTHIGYCINCGLPFKYLEVNSDFELHIKKEQNNKPFIEAQYDAVKKTFLNSSSIGEKQLKICNYYWGNDLVKSIIDIQAIVEINEELLLLSHGFNDYVYKAAVKLLKRYEQESHAKFELLKAALPDNVVMKALSAI